MAAPGLDGDGVGPEEDADAGGHAQGGEGLDVGGQSEERPEQQEPTQRGGFGAGPEGCGGCCDGS